MKTPRTSSAFTLLCISFSLLSVLSLSSFSPADHHLLSCGSSSDFILFASDADPHSPFHSGRTISVADPNPLPDSPQVHCPARVFQKPSKYVFAIGDPGTHVVRLQFQPFVSSSFDLSLARFHVLVNGYVVLSNFSVANEVKTPVVKEYFIWIDSNKLVITFLPTKKGEFGFFNAIEVISAPKDLIPDVATLVNADKVENFDGLTKEALETVYRVNVGGPKLTPFNDSLWRTWIPDDGFFKSSDLSKKVYFSGRIKYQNGGASREIGPDFVYGTARVISSTNSSIPKVNLTWEFPVVEGHKYLVRLHFCDIASISIGLLYFNVYVNGYLAYENLDLSSITYTLASPFYADFIVDQTTSPVLSVSIGPSNMSMGYTIDGILNGVEIMKMNNSVGSLDGNMCAGMVLNSWPRGNIGVSIPLLAVVCFLLGLSMFTRRTMGVRNPATWSRLPTDIAEVNSKHSAESYSGKV